MKRTWISAVLAIALGAQTARAQAPDAATLAETIQAQAIEAGDLGDNDQLEEVRALAERALTAYPDDPYLLHYYGYVLYRIASRHGCDEEAEPGCVWKMLERAEEVLEASLTARPLPETYALLGSVNGLMIGENNALGATLGSRIDALQAQGRALDPDNPRVWLLKGIGDFFTPEAFGGGAEAALRSLERAAEFFEADDPTPPEPRWGRVDVHVWLGQVHAARGEKEKAREEYQRVLALEPRHAWVRDVLLPGLDQSGG
jgi:tetratricopeptide (TPR) repeat protein